MGLLLARVPPHLQPQPTAAAATLSGDPEVALGGTVLRSAPLKKYMPSWLPNSLREVSSWVIAKQAGVSRRAARASTKRVPDLTWSCIVISALACLPNLVNRKLNIKLKCQKHRRALNAFLCCLLGLRSQASEVDMEAAWKPWLGQRRRGKQRGVLTEFLLILPSIYIVNFGEEFRRWSGFASVGWRCCSPQQLACLVTLAPTSVSITGCLILLVLLCNRLLQPLEGSF